MFRTLRSPPMTIKKILLITVFLSTLVACSSGTPNEKILFDFETDADLDRIHWKCFTLLKLTEDHAAHGSKSLQLELYPSDYPGLTPKLNEKDWRGCKALSFDIYNPADNEQAISIRIDDREDYPDYADRYNKKFILKPGPNDISIPLDKLITTGTKRKLNLKRIHRLLIFMGHPKEKHVLYIDYLRLLGCS
jgi:hypothetical protein